MHVVLTGATGFIGGEVLRQCLQQTRITKITILSRRALPNTVGEHARIKTVIMEDFTQHSTDDLNDVDACIWCIGGQSIETDLIYPVAFAKAVSKIISTQERHRPFRFVLCSGVLAERDQNKPLWFMGKERRAKGRGESEILNLASTSSKYEEPIWESYVMRPSMVLPVQASPLQHMMSAVLGGIRVDELAQAATHLVLHGHHADTLDNTALIGYARTSASPH